MIDMRITAKEVPDAKPRQCPHCGKMIVWQDLSGLHMQSWHYVGYMCAQATIHDNGEEKIDPNLLPFQKCGECQGDVSPVQMR